MAYFLANSSTSEVLLKASVQPLCRSLKTLSIWEFSQKVKWEGVTMTEGVMATALL